MVRLACRLILNLPSYGPLWGLSNLSIYRATAKLLIGALAT